MNNFGVIEVASGKSASAAPGWAYVPEAGPSLGAAATQTANRKRARNPLGGARLSYGDLSARQEAKMRKEVEALDRDAGRDVTIPLPVKSGRRRMAPPFFSLFYFFCLILSLLMAEPLNGASRPLGSARDTRG